jgi:hypothetical protein
MGHAIIEALEVQLGCYQRLAKLVHIQHGHVEQNEIEPLMEVLKRRQEEMSRIAEFEPLVGPAKRDWAGFVKRIDQALAARAEDLLAQVRLLLEQITTMDQNDALLLQQRKLNVGRQINQTSAAKQVNRTYAAAAYGSRPSRMNLQR